ncbi:MAG: phosphatase PAP2 family protein [Sutterellaceae bacterium]|nr:phosphatase PAP2 family protein [Sutterellaceae bacterium]MDD7441661.1 phosphatase PAP2 family protein [Sutterellaceae bacterium]MDY2868259.1 phosphatase PAP2 family protein [Mesosutterella sp.]
MNELPLLDAIQALHTPLLDSVMAFLTQIGNFGAVWALFACCLFLRRSTRRLGLFMFLALAAEALVCSGILKHAFARPRPFTLVPGFELLIPQPGGSSFPSAHAASSFTALFFLWFSGHPTLRRIAPGAAVLALLISFSRLYFYVHFPTDILAGAVLGGAIGYAAAKLGRSGVSKNF